jgi:hypothetical protein
MNFWILKNRHRRPTQPRIIFGSDFARSFKISTTVDKPGPGRSAAVRIPFDTLSSVAERVCGQEFGVQPRSLVRHSGSPGMRRCSLLMQPLASNNFQSVYRHW